MKLKEIRVDGYKNLINCKLELGDFNVLVGPNNSGKTNLLEVLTMLRVISWGSENASDNIFWEGLTPRGKGSARCMLPLHKNKPITLGFVFEQDLEEERWRIDYEISFQCHEEATAETAVQPGFIKEALFAKPITNTGPATQYIKRTPETLTVKTKKTSKKHKIARQISAASAIISLYPKQSDLPSILPFSILALTYLASSAILAVSPDGLRRNISSDRQLFSKFRVASFDLLPMIDEIKKNGKHYSLFETALCDILDLEETKFYAENISPSAEGTPETSGSERLRVFWLKRKGANFAAIQEYSDGTLVVTAILAVLLSGQRPATILCIEELENCLHPSALERLLRFLQDHSDQWPVLITTHSPHLLNGVDPCDVNVAVVDETGAVHFEKITGKKALSERLNAGYISFGDLLADNFAGVRGI